MGSPSGLIFVHLLADRALQPLGVQWVIEPGSEASFRSLVSSEMFKVLTSQGTCLISARDASHVPPELLEMAVQLGLTPMSDDAVCRCDDATPSPSAVNQWIDGNWFLAPPLKAKAAQAASRVMALKLVQLVSVDADTREIEDVFRQDPTLSYHLLRLVNSLAFGARRRISSFSQAIMMLGRQQLKRWLNLILFASGADDPRAPMLLGQVVVRARMMELLTQETGGDKAQQELAFMAGMFSMLGVLFGQPLEEVFKPLQLDEALQAAVLTHQGPIGQMLHLLECTEGMDSTAVSAWLEAAGMNADVFNRLLLESVQWMLGMRQEGSDD